jgi:hypothetical protein
LASKDSSIPKTYAHLANARITLNNSSHLQGNATNLSMASWPGQPTHPLPTTLKAQRHDVNKSKRVPG